MERIYIFHDNIYVVGFVLALGVNVITHTHTHIYILWVSLNCVDVF